MITRFIRTLELARKLVAEQFREYSNLIITEVEKQGHVGLYFCKLQSFMFLQTEVISVVFYLPFRWHHFFLRKAGIK